MNFRHRDHVWDREEGHRQLDRAQHFAPAFGTAPSSAVLMTSLRWGVIRGWSFWVRPRHWWVPRMGVFQNGCLIDKNPTKMDDLELPLFQETPIWYCIDLCRILNQMTSNQQFCWLKANPLWVQWVQCSFAKSVNLSIRYPWHPWHMTQSW